MRNFRESSVATTTVFNGQYETALATARSKQAKAPSNVSYTIEGKDANTKVNEHIGYLGGQPPYQEIVHTAN